MDLEKKMMLEEQNKPLISGNDLPSSTVQSLSSVAPSSSATFAIEGMTCGACVAAITSGLESLTGVSSAAVSLVTERALVHFDNNTVSSAEIKERIEDCGFDAKLLTESIIPSKLLSTSSPTTTSTTSTTSKNYNQPNPLDENSSSIYSASFAIVGMTCGACVSSITTNLEALDGVTSVAISLVTERGAVQFDSNRLSTDNIIETIEDSGFDATLISSTPLITSNINSNSNQINNESSIPNEQLKNIRLKVYGMTCSSCSNTVESVLREIDGVTDAIVNLVTEEALIYYYPSKIGPRSLVEAIEDAGFNAILSSTADNALQLESLSRVKAINKSRNEFFLCAALGIPVFSLVRFVPSLFPFLAFLKKQVFVKGLYLDDIINLFLTIPIQFYVGGKFYKASANAIRHKSLTMDVLVCISTSCAFFFSIFAMIYSICSQSSNHPSTLWETPAMIVTFIVGGKYLENKAKGQTSIALSRLISLSPSTATIYTNPENYFKATKDLDSFSTRPNVSRAELSAPASPSTSATESQLNDILLETKSIPTELIQSGDIVVVLPGEKVSADGIILRGETYVDESLVTGESLAVSKVPGDEVICGSINGFGRIDIKVIHSGNETKLSHIVQLVQDAQTSKTSIQRYADYVAGFFVPVVILLGFTTFLVWMVLSHVLHRPPHIFNNEESKFMVCLRLCISVIVVACPCALGLATPTAVMVGTGVGATNGILIKGGAVLETANKITTVLFDKTGTLTTGDMNVISFGIAENVLKKLSISADDWWKYIGCLEQSSEHPIARGILKKVRETCGLGSSVEVEGSVIDFKVKVGYGVSAKINLSPEVNDRFSEGKKTPGYVSVCVGNVRMLEDFGVQNIPGEVKDIEKKPQGQTVVVASFDGIYAGYIVISDTIRNNARETVYALKKLGLSVGIVSGDHPSVVSRVAKEVGIPSQLTWGGISPEGKLAIVDQLQSKDVEGGALPSSFNLDGCNEVVAMVGDGINDSPALARATLGISMAGATDVAMDAADIVLLKENSLLDVAASFELCHVIFRRIKLNLMWAVVYNAIMIPIAMGCFLPLGLVMHPVFAGAAMAFSSVSVVASSLMLQLWKRPKWMQQLYISTETDMTTGAAVSRRQRHMQQGSTSSSSSLSVDEEDRESTSSSSSIEPFSIFQRIKNLFVSSSTSTQAKQHQYSLLPN